MTCWRTCAATGPLKCTITRDVCFGEDASRVSRAHQAMAAIRNTVIGILHLHRIPNIAAQLRSCHRDPCRLPLQLLGLTRPQVPLTGNHAVTRTRQSPRTQDGHSAAPTPASPG